MWKSHWGLARDPFAEADSPYVSLPSHDEAVSRLAFAVDSPQRRVILAAPGGMGKTKVLHRMASLVAGSRRRIIAANCAGDATLLFSSLAERLGQRVGREPSRLAVWRALERAIRVAATSGGGGRRDR